MTHQKWCREHTSDIIKNCPISKSQANRLLRAKKMGSDWPPLSPFPDTVLLAVGKLKTKKKIEIVAREVMARNDRGETVTEAIVEEMVRQVQEGRLPSVSPAQICAASTEAGSEKPATAPEMETDKSELHSSEISGNEPEPEKEKTKKVRPQQTPTTFKGLTRHLRTNYSDREAEIVEKILAYLKGVPV